MNSIKVKGHAKINITLDVIRKLNNGYHELEMVMESLELHDNVTIQINNSNNINFNCNKFLGNSEDNLCYKAAKLFLDKYNISQGVDIYLEKNIFVAAGLAGGSADAAATLVGLNTLFNINLTNDELMELGVKLGADVPYCITKSTMLAKGIGEKLTKLPKHPPIYVLLIKPPIEVLTKDIFENLEINNIQVRPSLNKVIQALENKNIEDISKNLINVLETVTIAMHPIIQDVKDEMLKKGALNTLMSGSGPTVFGYYTDYDTMIEASIYLKNKFPNFEDITCTKILE